MLKEIECDKIRQPSNIMRSNIERYVTNKPSGDNCSTLHDLASNFAVVI